jgi:hypothetical protein
LKRSQTNTPIPEETPSELDSPTQTFSELKPTSLDDTPGSWDFLLGDELPDVECTELQDGYGDEEDMELNSETALASFAQFLVDAQKAAQKAEHRLEQETGRKKRRRGYTGHSRQTAQRRKQTETKMREQGYSDIRSFFGSAGMAPNTTSSSNKISEISSDSENDSANESSTDTESVEIPIAVSLKILNSFVRLTCLQPPSADVETFMDPVNLAHVHLKELLEAISHNSLPVDNSPESLAENKLNQLTYRNFPALQRAADQLELESKKKEHDLVFRGRIQGMLGTLKLYLNPLLSYSWRQSSMIVSESQGHGSYLARRIREWLHTYLSTGKLPLHKIGRYAHLQRCKHYWSKEVYLLNSTPSLSGLHVAG